MLSFGMAHLSGLAVPAPRGDAWHHWAGGCVDWCIFPSANSGVYTACWPFRSPLGVVKSGLWSFQCRAVSARVTGVLGRLLRALTKRGWAVWPGGACEKGSRDRCREQECRVPGRTCEAEEVGGEAGSLERKLGPSSSCSSFLARLMLVHSRPSVSNWEGC